MANLKDLTEHKLSADEVRGLQSGDFNPKDVADVLMGIEDGERLSVPVVDHRSYLSRLRNSGVDVRKEGKGDFGYTVERNGAGQKLVLYRR